MVGGQLLMKKNVVPHRFTCQVDKRVERNPRILSVARERRRLVSLLLENESATDNITDNMTGICCHCTVWNLTRLRCYNKFFF